MALQYLQGNPNEFQWGQGEFQGTGGGVEAQRYYAWKKFSQLFGRNPTEAELSQLAGAYASGDANKANVSGGDSVIAQYYNSQVNTPEQQAKDQQKKYLEEAPQYYDDINSQFQGQFGRDATDEEREHFGSLMASGGLNSYTLGQYLTQLPEAVKKQDAEFQESLRTKTSAEDARYFNEQIMPGIQSNFAKSGRSFESSGFANALAQAAQQQNVNRESFLTNLSAEQYGGNKANAYNEYLNSVGRMQAGQDYSRGRRDQLGDALQGRLYDIQNFNMQKQAYDDYLSRYGKRKSPFAGALGGAFQGASIGATAGGPWGAVAGGLGGGLLGGFAGSY